MVLAERAAPVAKAGPTRPPNLAETAVAAAGLATLERLRSRVPADVPFVGDAKRGDIGSTARAYAGAYLEPRGTRPPLADALTVNPYLGGDSLDPFAEAGFDAPTRFVVLVAAAIFSMVAAAACITAPP